MNTFILSMEANFSSLVAEDDVNIEIDQAIIIDLDQDAAECEIEDLDDPQEEKKDSQSDKENEPLEEQDPSDLKSALLNAKPLKPVGRQKILNKLEIKNILAKRCCNAYWYFSDEKRKELVQKHPNLPLPLIMRMVGEEWNKIEEKDKHNYVALARKEKQYFKGQEKLIPKALLDKILAKKAAKCKIDWRDGEEFQEDGGDLSDTGLIKPPSKPKNPMTMFKCYYQDMKEKLEKSDPNLTSDERKTRITQSWKSSTLDDKQHFRELALNDKKRYEKEFDKYLQNTYLFTQMTIQHKKCKKSPKPYHFSHHRGYSIDPAHLTVPKRPMSAYMIFSQEERDRIRTKMAHCSYDEIQRAVSI